MSALWDRMADLAACLCVQIETDGSPVPCFCGVVPGSTILGTLVTECDDDAEDCGMAWVRLAGAFPSGDMLSPDSTAGNCGKPLGIQIEIGILRCITVIDEDGNGPDAAEMMASAEQQTKDMLTMRRAIACCDALPNKEWVLGVFEPANPFTGFAGGTWTLSMGDL